jgi:hypothetical protein
VLGTQETFCIVIAGLFERDSFDHFLPAFDKPWVIHLRETCCCSTNLCTWRPNTVYKNRSMCRHHLLGFLGFYGKTKDTPEAREDQHRMKRRDGMHPDDSKGSASYALTKEEKEIFFECLSSIKVPSGFSSNIKGIINMAEKKFQNLKSHDCHVLMM